MSGNNGKADLVSEATAIMNESAKKGSSNHLLVGLIPFTPVSFSGPNMLLAVARIAGYSALAYFTYNKMRPVSYACMGAVGVCVATSLLANWGTHVVDDIAKEINIKAHNV